ncbi:PREDICTED: AP-1 complex subunit mu-2-like [Calidris pugnax]|uniref:AP-1 complex subunit mu-2-like n=1 Tax=Calidris pugnax TaxID=198806 RepID=UPI00071E1B9D|nr:PREDICTED: AP-1 complex subunit mu-2-like [Calidris pugnax]
MGQGHHQEPLAVGHGPPWLRDPSPWPLISRNYKGDVGLGEIDHFMGLLLQREEEGTLAPLLTHGHVHFLWIKHANLYRILPVTHISPYPPTSPSHHHHHHRYITQEGNKLETGKSRVPTTVTNAVSWRSEGIRYKKNEVFIDVIESVNLLYFKELEEESIRDNFVIVYELLDELMDFGFPQTTDSKILQEYITQEGNKLETGKSRVPTTVTNAVSWRSEGIRYKKNEVFIDVIESVNLLVSANGSVLLSEVVGTIKLKVFLSGMPELRLGLNDRVLFELTGRGTNKSVELEDVKFHQCVRLSRFDNDRTISFIPPDGDFELMSYRLHTQVSANGSILLSEVVGTIKLKVFLSGMPELRLGLNDRVLFELTGRGTNKSVELEDVKFHQCVRLSRFDNDRTISFIPPDGDFELMSYRLHTQVKPLIWIESVIEKFSHSRVEIMVKAKGQFKKQSVANGVEIAVPVPSDADSPKFKTTVGSAKYLPEKNLVIWTIKSFPGGKEHLMRAHFGLPSVEKEEEEGRPPIAVRFEIPYFTVSGIQVTLVGSPGWWPHPFGDGVVGTWIVGVVAP